MISKAEIEQIVETYLASDPCLFLVEVTVDSQNRITVTIDSDSSVDISICVALSKHIESCLDRDIEDFELEVGSAGISSPIVSLRQWQKYIDKPVEILLKTGVKEVGRLLFVDSASICLEVVRRIKPEGSKRKKDVPTEVQLALDDIKRACYKVEM